MMFQMSSPHLPNPPPPSAQHLPPPQVTSLHICSSPVSSPHVVPEIPYVFPQAPVTSPHLPLPHVTSPHHTQPHSHLLPHPQVTSPVFPHPCLTSPNLVPQPRMASPHFVAQPQATSPHLLSPPQYHIYNQTHNLSLDHPHWSRAEPPSELSYLLNSDGYSFQNQITTHLELQDENQFSTGEIQQQDELGNTYRTPYSVTLDQCDTSGLVQDTWRPLGPIPSPLQGSRQGSTSGEVTTERWSSMDSSSTPFYQNNAPQPFCSPTIPGPNSPQMHPGEEKLDFPTSGQLSSNKTLSHFLYDSYHMVSNPSQHQPHQTGQHLFLSQSELIQDQAGFLETTGNSESHFSLQVRGQEVSGATQSPVLPGGPSWREECGGGRGKRRGRAENGQQAWSGKKQPKKKVLDCRLACTVCNRDFRSLPALNGHMRSHSGSRSVTGSNKSGASSHTVSRTISAPVQPRVPPQGCTGGQRRCGSPLLTAGHPALYHSLLHQQSAAGEDGEVAAGDEVEHYTPPPMLCPLRAGPGLYCSLTTWRQQRARAVQRRDAPSDLVAMETASPPSGTLTTGINKPQINIGRGFQAEIPPLRRQRNAHSDSHNALLVWTTWGGLETPVSQQRVEALLMMARSSVVPGGGASPEFALHVLSECRGDFLMTAEKLLSTPETSDNHRAAQQNKSVSWSTAEKRLLVKSLRLHRKDFSRIQKAVPTKSLSQCVEFYYLWKKKLNLNARAPAGPNR